MQSGCRSLPRRAIHGERALSARVAALGTEPPVGRERIIPVVYGGEDGPDLGEISALTGLGEREIVGRHAASAVRVLFDGFAPGFAYLGDLPVDLHVARLPTPRTRTPAGSLAIAGSMTGIYPASLPGGYGRTGGGFSINGAEISHSRSMPSAVVNSVWSPHMAS